MLNSAFVTEMAKTARIIFIKENTWLINEGKTISTEENQRLVRKFTSLSSLSLKGATKLYLIYYWFVVFILFQLYFLLSCLIRIFINLHFLINYLEKLLFCLSVFCVFCLLCFEFDVVFKDFLNRLFILCLENTWSVVLFALALNSL